MTWAALVQARHAGRNLEHLEGADRRELREEQRAAEIHVDQGVIDALVERGWLTPRPKIRLTDDGREALRGMKAP